MTAPREINIAKAFGASEARAQRFAVYIPNKDRDGNEVDQNRWIVETIQLLSEICGGATAMPPIKGAWLNKEDNKLVLEEPVLVYTFIEPDSFANRISDVVALVRQIGKETRQGQMAIEFNQTFFLIDIE